VLQSRAALHLGQWNLAVTSADEGARLAEETGEPLWYAGGRIGHGFVAALRGDYELAESHVAEAERIVLPYQARALLASVTFVRGLSALGGGRHGDAYEQLRRLFDPADPAFHAMERSFAVGDLAEAAAHSGNEHEARALVAEIEDVATQTPAARIHITLRHARAVLAGDGEAEVLYQAGLDADLGRWPFDRARLLLAYGAWLRRRRRVAESRAPLRAARETFDALGAAPWSERARRELRASGETSRSRAPEAWAELSPQELQIAEMAAEGLTNREIGQKLYLSPRTVGSHLYRLFPKLGVTSRSQLATAVQSLD
jgi:DNA-binding CsgD family transcriptional regulator